MGTSVIAVRVGAEPRHTDFTVNEKLICESSDFFKAALAREWRESQERLVKLPSCHQKYFHIYVQWLYSGHLHVSDSGDVKTAVAKANLMQSYLLADFLQDSRYKDFLMDTIREWVKGSTVRECESLVQDYAEEMFRETATESSIRRLLVDAAVWRLGHSFWKANKVKLPAEFTQEAVSGFSDRCQFGSSASDPFVPDKRGYDVFLYHFHGKKKCHGAGQEES